MEYSDDSDEDGEEDDAHVSLPQKGPNKLLDEVSSEDSEEA